MSRENLGPFQMVAGNVALDLVNTLDFRFRESGPEELLPGYDDLLGFVTQAGLMTAPEAGVLRRLSAREPDRSRMLNRVRQFREALSGTLYALADRKTPPSEPLALLKREFLEAFSSRTLEAHEGAIQWRFRSEFDLATPLQRLALEAEELLLSQHVLQIRYCASDTCRWLFLDTSKSHTRRWCDMKVCGNRMKARRFQARVPG